MNTIRRIKEYLEFKGISNRRFEGSVGFSNGAFASQLKNNRTIGVDKLENILKIYPDINPTWLLTGEGDMLRFEHKNTEAENRDVAALYSSEIENNKGQKFDVYNKLVYSNPEALKITSLVTDFHADAQMLAIHIQNYNPYELILGIVAEYNSSDVMTFRDVEAKFKSELKNTVELYKVIQPYRRQLTEMLEKVEAFNNAHDRKFSFDEEAELETFDKFQKSMQTDGE